MIEKKLCRDDLCDFITEKIQSGEIVFTRYGTRGEKFSVYSLIDGKIYDEGDKIEESLYSYITECERICTKEEYEWSLIE